MQTGLQHVWLVAQDNIKIRRDKHRASTVQLAVFNLKMVKRRVMLVLPTPTPSPLVNLDVTVWWDTPAAADMQTGL